MSANFAPHVQSLVRYKRLFQCIIWHAFSCWKFRQQKHFTGDSL